MFVHLILLLFVSFIASQHTLNQLRLQQYTSPTVCMSLLYVARGCPFGVRSNGGRYMYHSYGNQALLLPDSEQPLYQEMFEAVWDGDVEAVRHMTTKLDDKDRLLVCVQDSQRFTPLVLAAYRGHTAVVTLLLKVAAEQYTPLVRVTREAHSNSLLPCCFGDVVRSICAPLRCRWRRWTTPPLGAAAA